MSRAIWHFAVVSPSLADELAPALGRESVDLIAAETALHAVLQYSPERIAYFSAVMDGWNGHWLLQQLGMRGGSEIGEVVDSLMDQGFAWVRPGKCPSGGEELAALIQDANEPGRYAVEMVVDGLRNLMDFVRSTGCVGVTLFRVLGPVIDDSEFLKR